MPPGWVWCIEDAQKSCLATSTRVPNQQEGTVDITITPSSSVSGIRLPETLPFSLSSSKRLSLACALVSQWTLQRPLYVDTSPLHIILTQTHRRMIKRVEGGRPSMRGENHSFY